MTEKAEDSIRLFDELRTARATWDDHYQIIGEYVHGTSQEFTEQNEPGERLNEDRHTSAGVFASRSLASALIGMLWPNSAQSMQLIPSRQVTDNEENKEYFNAVTSRMADDMDDPLANLAVSLDEYMLDNVSFGTSGIGVFSGKQSLLHYEPWGTSQLYISEGDEGRVETEIKKVVWPLHRVIATFGVDRLSERLRNLWNEGKNVGERVKILHIIKKRLDRDVTGKSNLDMPYASVFLELETKHIIKESGFDENPVLVTRFRKLATEQQGRSPGMDALSDILELDYLTERFTVNVDKSGDPPLIVMNDGRFGGGIIDTSAGAINVFDGADRLSNNIDPIRPLQTVGELNTTLTRMEQLRDSIAQHFFLDKLLDFNNQTEMTASEALLRDRIRAAALGSIFTRQISELFNPLISRTFNLLLKNNRLGVIENSPEHQQLMAQDEEDILIIPSEIAKKMTQGKNVFEIKYFTPAARMLQLQRAEALNQLTGYIQVVQAGAPDAGDLLDTGKAIKLAAEVAGLSEIIRPDEDVEAIRDARQEQQTQDMQAQQENLQSDTAKNLTEAGLA